MLMDGCTDGKRELLESVQYEAGKVVTGSMRETSRIRITGELAREEIQYNQLTSEASST